MSFNVITPEAKAEDYSPEDVTRLELVGPCRHILTLLHEEMISRKIVGMRTAYIEGYYGSGKTVLLRKFASETLKTQDLIPIYIYLGGQDFRPFNILERYVSIVRNYVERGIPHPAVIGHRENWNDKLRILESIINEVREHEKSERLEKIAERPELNRFLNALRIMNEWGKYPILILDEFERLIYTGEGLQSDDGIMNFTEFATKFLEISRGHLFQGGLVLALTAPLSQLIERAVQENFPHIDRLRRWLNIDIRASPQLFPMLSASITYNIYERIIWDSNTLQILAKRYNLAIHWDLIQLVAQVLPTPRAIISIARRIRALQGAGEKDEILKHTDFYELIKPKIDQLEEELKKARLRDGKFVVAPKTVWLNNFKRLLKNGIFSMTSNNIDDVALALGITDEDPRKRRQKTYNRLKKMTEVGLLEKIGSGEFRLRPTLLAYFLDIERLPDGRFASLSNVIDDIKYSVEVLKQKHREKAEKKSAQQALGG